MKHYVAHFTHTQTLYSANSGFVLAPILGSTHGHSPIEANTCVALCMSIINQSTVSKRSLFTQKNAKKLKKKKCLTFYLYSYFLCGIMNLATFGDVLAMNIFSQWFYSKVCEGLCFISAYIIWSKKILLSKSLNNTKCINGPYCQKNLSKQYCKTCSSGQ